MGNRKTTKTSARRKFKNLLGVWTKEGLKPQCVYCGLRHFDSNNPLTADHVIPIAKGGLSAQVNLAPACLKCNQAKGMSMWSPLFERTYVEN